jgi:hypothetical protein
MKRSLRTLPASAGGEITTSPETQCSNAIRLIQARISRIALVRSVKLFDNAELDKTFEIVVFSIFGNTNR